MFGSSPFHIFMTQLKKKYLALLVIKCLPIILKLLLRVMFEQSIVK